MSTRKKVIFFPNGNSMVFIDGAQVPSMQESWLVKFFEFMESQGHDPTEFEIRLPNATYAIPFRTEHGWNWEVE